MKVDDIHQWLSEKSYWSKHIPYEVVKGAFDNSFCIGVLYEDRQIGYARFITDYNVFAYLADVFVQEEHQGKGLSKTMMAVLMNEEWVKRLRKTMLATLDAHGLYEQFGFAQSVHPERIMEISRPAIYGDESSILR